MVPVNIGGLSSQRVGSGPPVLFVHGWGGLKEGWTGLPDAIAAAGFASITVDLPGWGDSRARRRFPHTEEGYGVAIGRALDEIGPASIIAHSMGAQGTLVLARHRPALLRRIVMIAPALTPAHEVRFPPRAPRDLVRYPLVGLPLARLALLYLRRDVDRWREAFLRTFAAPERFAGDRELERALTRASVALTTTSTRTLAASARSALAFDVRPWAHLVPHPILGVIGEGDRVAYPEPTADAIGRMPDATVMRVSESAHFPHVEARDAVTSAIIEHLRA